MSIRDGFELIEDREISEINSRVQLLRHKKTGAQILSLQNDDDNKVFGVTFRTPTPDDTGVAHILEHSVLSGSRKYPVKELFFEILKGSLATHLNAATSRDHTMYPVASQNLQDFYNLVDVYLDVVFFPLLERETLMQEGWHYELEDPEDELVYRGVVFNEMKGVYSSPEGLIYRQSLPNLFPDTPYRFDSGGVPQAIPNLTYENFKKFHETYYHPSNALIFFSGNDDPEKRLELLAEYLDQFDALEVDSRMPLAKSFEHPRSAQMTYPVSQDDTDAKSYIMMSWALSEPHDIETTFSFEVLAHVLMGTAASPLKKALIESGLGENTLGGGVSTWSRLVFGVGMKGVKLTDAQAVETLVLETLKSLVNDGIDPKDVEASLNTIEFQLREFNTGGMPQGLGMMYLALSTWLYDGDPLAALEFESTLEHLKQQAQTPGYFKGFIQRYLLDNPHRSTVVMAPDPEMNDRLLREEKAHLDTERQAMGAAHIRKIIEETKMLQEMQRTPNTPEQLDALPLLSLDDLDRDVKIVPLEVQNIGDTEVIYHDLFTNGIFYLDVAFDLTSLPQDLLPYVSLFGQALLEMGTEQQNYVEFMQRIGSKTGGISPSRMSGNIWNSDDAAFWFVLRGKSTTDRVPDMIDILKDMILSVNFDNKERFRQFATKIRASKESGLIPGGTGVIFQRMDAGYSLPGWFDEATGGIAQLFFLRDVLNNLDSKWDDVLNAFERIRSLLFTRANLLINATVDGDNWRQIRDKLTPLYESLPDGKKDRQVWSPVINPIAEGLTIPAQVNYVGKAGNIYELGYQHHGSVNVISRSMTIGYLFDRIRVQGGAYGMAMRFSPTSGILKLGSYRDPNLLKTLDVYDEMADHLRNTQLSEKALTQAIVGAIGSMDQYQLPDAKGFSSFMHYLTNYTDEIRQKVRDEILATKSSDFTEFGEVINKLADVGVPVVLGSAEAIRAASDEANLGLTITRVL